MSYTALYRKYRPKTFDDVIGQEPITATLTNQIKLGKISHAYLFSGSRGTGKTSCAKIFAKAVNCAAPKNGSPCGKCEICKSLDDPANIDVLEIDAASNNKVDEVREIRERVKYLPVKGRYKVYIIDEVHMLTDSAFNALLKTLEEPPAHVIFILATTEAHKLPATILSRCMRFDFRLVPSAELSVLLKKVYDAEKKKYEQEAVDYIADAAEGSVRDSLSIADMCLNFSEGKLTYPDVLRVLGAPDRERIAELFCAISAGKVGEVFLKIDGFANAGKSMSLLAKELAKYARDLLAIKSGGENLVAGTKEHLGKMRIAADGASADLLIYMIGEFSKIDAELRYSVSPRVVLESTAVRAARLSGDDYAALSERVRLLEKEKNGLGTAVRSEVSQNREQAGAIPVLNAQEGQIARIPVQSIGAAVKTVLEEDAKSIWGRLVTRFRKAGNMNLYTLLGEHLAYKIVGRELVITAEDDKFLRFSEPSAVSELDYALSEVGAPLKIRVEKKAVGVDMDKEIERVRKLTGLEPKIER